MGKMHAENSFLLYSCVSNGDLKTLQLPDGRGFLKVVVLMNFVKLRVYISYPWIIVVCIYLFKYRVQHVLF